MVRFRNTTCTGICLAVMLLLSWSAVQAQMVTGAGMEDFAKVLALEGARAKDFAVIETACSVPANVLWPGDEATFTFRIENRSNEPIQAPAKVHVVHYGTRGRAWRRVEAASLQDRGPCERGN